MKQIIILLILISCISLVSAEHALPTDLVDSDTGLMEGLGDWANGVTGGAYWTMMLLGFCIVLGVSSSRYGIDKAFGYAGTTGLLGSIPLMILGWIPWYFGSMFIIVGAISIVAMIKAK